MQPGEHPLATKSPQESDLVRTTTYIHVSDADTDVEVESATAAAVPQQVARFLIRQRLGEGGFGSVYLAYDPTLDREIALKLPSRQRSWTKDRQEAFLEEARIAARLKHPHVAAIYDAGSSDEVGVFIAMEYVAGESLAQRLRRGKLPLDEATRICGQVAEAMHHGHKLGLVHRDLKPSNVLLDQGGNVKVCDFGLALREERQQYRRGDASGTLSYMSPEQVRGESHHLDGRSDIWSLGVILYECLAGRRPFRGDTNDELRDEILTRDPKPLRQLDDSIPPALDELCLKCLQRSPTERLSTALDFQQALSERPAPRRRRRVAALATAAVLVLVAAAVLAAVAVPGILSQTVVTPLPGKGTTNLLAGQPQVVFFSPAGGQNHWTHLNEQLTVDSHHWSLFSLGSFVDKAKLNLSAKAAGDQALCGTFWGLHPERGSDGTTMESCLLAVVEPNQEGGKSAMVRLYRFDIGKDADFNPSISFTHNYAGIPLEVQWNKPIGMELDITEGELTALRVQGQEVRLPLEKFPPEWKAFSGGRCGVAAWKNKITFTSALLTSP